MVVRNFILSITSALLFGVLLFSGTVKYSIYIGISLIFLLFLIRFTKILPTFLYVILIILISSIFFKVVYIDSSQTLYDFTIEDKYMNSIDLLHKSLLEDDKYLTDIGFDKSEDVDGITYEKNNISIINNIDSTQVYILIDENVQFSIMQSEDDSRVEYYDNEQNIYLQFVDGKYTGGVQDIDMESYLNTINEINNYIIENINKYI